MRRPGTREWRDGFFWQLSLALRLLSSPMWPSGFRLFPAMGWGRPDSPGHDLDLASAVLGIGLLVAGSITFAMKRGR